MNKELELSYAQFQKVKEQFILRIESKSKEQQVFQPEEGAWSMVGVFEHITNSEEQILAFIDKYPPSEATHKIRLKDKVAYKLLVRFFKSPKKVEIPNKALNPSGGKSWNELLEKSKNNELALKKILENFPEDKLKYSTFKHPISGRMTMKQTVDFWKNHMIHHSHQLDRIEAHVNYPKE